MARLSWAAVSDPSRPVRRRTDAAIAAAVFCAAAALGSAYVATWGGVAMYWQEVFAPAVCVACGMEPANPYFDDVPELEDFLYQRADTFDCAVLQREGIHWIPFDPGDRSFDELQASHPLREFPGFIWWQHFHWYLLWTVAQCWKLFGVSWASLWPLFGLLYGLTAVAAYGLFRLAARPVPALAFTLLLVCSPLHLEQLPHLRDYGKAPFFLFALLGAGWLIKRERGWPRLLGVSASVGLLLGIGVGFRQDVAIALAAFAGSVAAFYPAPLRASWTKRLAAAALCIVLFQLAGYPILAVLAKQNNAPHDTLIGFQDYCHQRLGVGHPNYDYGDPFKDEHTRAAVARYALDFHDSPEPLRHYSARYDAMGRAYFLEIARHFPADLVTRAFASVLRVLDEQRPRGPLPEGWYDSALAPLFHAREAAASVLDWGSRYTAVLAILLLAAVRPAWGLAALCLLYLYAGYPSLRFSTRHVFHLEFLPFWISALFLHSAWVGVWMMKARGQLDEEARRRLALPTARVAVRNAACVGLAALALTFLPWQALKAWQDPQVAGLLRQYEGAPREELYYEQAPRQADGTGFMRYRIGWDHFAGQRGLTSRCEVLAIRLAPGEAPLDLEFIFEAEDDHYDFSRKLAVPAGGPATVYFPAYFAGNNRFSEVRIFGERAVLGFERLQDVSAMPILPTAVLPEGWEQSGLYLRFTR